MGMDLHSSGITTSVIGALKRGLGPLQDELGLYVCGGRGQHSRLLGRSRESQISYVNVEADYSLDQHSGPLP